jgi:uncharacterized protein YndB with AHSA1/START domain
MVEASAENHWELRIERLVPLKRHVAYRVMVNHISEWWWHPSFCPVSYIQIDWRANGVFRVKDDSGNVIQEGIILEVRPGWDFQMTDALHVGGRPARPSMVGSWSFSTTPKDHPSYEMVRSHNGNCSTFSAVIKHFSHADYLRSRALGFEQGWNEAADRLVKFCEARHLTS